MFLTGRRASTDDRSPWGDFWFQPVAPRTGSGVRVSGDSALALTAVYACVRNLAEDIAKLPFRMYQPRASGGRDPVTDHWLYRLIAKRPNAWQTPFEWREMMQGHLELRGNAFNRLIVTGAGEVTDVIPLHPDRVKLELLDNGSFRYVFTDRQGNVVRFRRDEIWHIKGLSADGYVGYSPIQLQAEMLGVGMSAQAYAGRFFANDARPSGGWVKHPGNFKDKTQRDNWRESWQQQQSGVNRGKVAVLEYGMDYHEVGVNNKEAQFIESRQLGVVEVARMFRMPPHKIQELSRSTFSNIEQQNTEYATDAIQPRCERLEDSIVFNLLGDDTDFEVELDLRSLMRGDSAARATRASTLIMAGVLTRNEARDDEGLNPIDGLDEPLQPLNMVEAGQQPVAPAISKPPVQTPADEPSGDEADARLVALLTGNAQRLARRIAVGKPASAKVVADAMAVTPLAASAWLATLQPEMAEADICASLTLLGKHGQVVEPSVSSMLSRVVSTLQQRPASVVNVAPATVNVAAPVSHIVVNTPPQRAVERTVERDADGVIQKLIDRPIDET